MNLLTIASLVAAGLAGAWALTLTTREREESPSPSGDGPGHDGARVGVPFPATDVMEHLTDAFFHVDREWRLTYFNPAAERYLEGLGHDPRKRVGRSFVEAFAGQRAEDAEFRKLRDAMETGSPVTYTTRAETLDAWLEIRAFPSAGGLAVYVRDVTERREAEERFQTLVEHAPEAIVVVDMDEGRVVELNRNAVELYGRTEEELRETVPYQFSPPVQPDGRPSVEKANELLQRALDGESPVFEWVHLTGDGREIQTEVRLVRLPSRNRRLVRGSVTDITDRKRAEEALRESEERFRDLFHADVAGNFVTTPDGRLLECNQAFAQMFGFESVEEALASQVEALHVSSRHREQLVDLVRREGKVQYYELEARTVDGSPLHVIENVRGVFDEEGRLTELRGHLIDVTEQKVLEEQLEQAQKLEAVGRLAGGIAHDFNNLLTTVTGHTELLLNEPGLAEQVRDDLEKIRKAAERAAELTSQLLAFSRKQVLQPTVCSLNDVVDEVARMLRRVIGEDVELTLQTHPLLQPVRADPGQLEQVVMNLAVNARDAMPRGGSLHLVTRNLKVTRGGDPRYAEVDPGRYAVLEVRDTGEGIPEERMEKIFEPFYTSKGPGKGTGLGLAMVYGIVKQSGGYVEVESTVGHGSVFTILLPVAESAAEAPAILGDDRGEDTGSSRTVLLVQTDPVVRKLVRRVLRREGHSVLEAQDVEDARAYSREWQGPIHLLVADALGDEAAERSLLETFIEHRPEASILRTISQSIGEGLPHHGPGKVIHKPFSPQELVYRVRDLLAAPSPGDPELLDVE